MQLRARANARDLVRKWASASDGRPRDASATHGAFDSTSIARCSSWRIAHSLSYCNCQRGRTLATATERGRAHAIGDQGLRRRCSRRPRIAGERLRRATRGCVGAAAVASEQLDWRHCGWASVQHSACLVTQVFMNYMLVFYLIFVRCSPCLSSLQCSHAMSTCRVHRIAFAAPTAARSPLLHDRGQAPQGLHRRIFCVQCSPSQKLSQSASAKLTFLCAPNRGQMEFAERLLVNRSGS